MALMETSGAQSGSFLLSLNVKLHANFLQPPRISLGNLDSGPAVLASNTVVSFDHRSNSHTRLSVFKTGFHANDFAVCPDEHVCSPGDFGGQGESNIQIRTGFHILANHEIKTSRRDVTSLALLPGDHSFKARPYAAR